MMLNQKDVSAGQPLDDIRRKQRLTNEVEPLMYKVRKNIKVNKSNKGEAAGQGLDGYEAEDLKEFAGWKESFLKCAEGATAEQYSDHCWQL